MHKREAIPKVNHEEILYFCQRPYLDAAIATGQVQVQILPRPSPARYCGLSSTDAGIGFAGYQADHGLTLEDAELDTAWK